MVVIWSVITDQFFRSVIWSVIWLFLVVLSTSDGSKIVNKASGDSPSMKIGSGDDNLHKEAYLGGRETAHGVSSLPKVRSIELPRKIKLKTIRGQRQKLGSSGKMVNRKHFQPQGGIILIFFMNFLFHLCLILFLCKRKYGEISRGLNSCFFYDLKRSFKDDSPSLIFFTI